MVLKHRLSRDDVGPAATARDLVLHLQLLLSLEVLNSVLHSLFLYFFFHLHTNYFIFLHKQLACCMAVQNYSLFSLMVVVYLDLCFIYSKEFFHVNNLSEAV